jgi:hypothetical protein
MGVMRMRTALTVMTRTRTSNKPNDYGKTVFLFLLDLSLFIITIVGQRISASADAGKEGHADRGTVLACSPLQLVMSKQQHWHEGSRADYITSLALSRSHAESHGRFFPSHSRPNHNHHDNAHTSKHMPKRLQHSAIPDLRFEPTYLAKLSTAGSDWKSIAWITVRDHAISPLLQGVLWCVVFISQPHCLPSGPTTLWFS